MSIIRSLVQQIKTILRVVGNPLHEVIHIYALFDVLAELELPGARVQQVYDVFVVDFEI
jgi:hypothetical protein